MTSHVMSKNINTSFLLTIKDIKKATNYTFQTDKIYHRKKSSGHKQRKKTKQRCSRQFSHTKYYLEEENDIEHDLELEIWDNFVKNYLEDDIEKKQKEIETEYWDNFFSNEYDPDINFYSYENNDMCWYECCN